MTIWLASAAGGTFIMRLTRGWAGPPVPGGSAGSAPAGRLPATCCRKADWTGVSKRLTSTVQR